MFDADEMVQTCVQRSPHLASRRRREARVLIRPDIVAWSHAEPRLPLSSEAVLLAVVSGIVTLSGFEMLVTAVAGDAA
jgi:hypothetical protein